MYRPNMNYRTAINRLRGTTDLHAEHAKHIHQISRCMEDAFTANNIQYDMDLWEIRETLKKQREEIDELKRVIQAFDKNNTPPSAPVPADIFITPQSLRQVKKDLYKALN